MRRDDDNRRPGGDGGPVGGGDPFSLEGFVVPDDAHELDADVRALRRERRAEARRNQLRRLFLTRRWRQYGMSGPIVVGVLLLVAAFASLMLLFQPRRLASRPEPLATGVPAAGQEGGLLPDVALQRADGQSVPLRAYRPAVVALLPRSCGCDSLIRIYGLAALRHHLAVVLVGTDLPAAPAELADPSVVRASEPSGRLAAAYRLARGPVLLLVHGDGVVHRQPSQEPTASALDGELALLVATGSGGGS